MAQRGLEWDATLKKDIDRIAERVELIKKSDPSKGEYFADLIEKVRNYPLDDTQASLITKKYFIDNIVALETEISYYLKGDKYHVEEEEQINLETGKPFSKRKIVFDAGMADYSGIEKMKQYRIGKYEEAFHLMKQFPLEQLSLIKLQEYRKNWSLEEETYRDIFGLDYRYSAMERDKVERVFAEAFLDYQLKYIKHFECFPEYLSIDNYCLPEIYAKILKEYFLEKIKEDAVRKIEYQNKNAEDFIYDKNVWKELTGVEMNPPKKTMLPSVKVKKIRFREKRQDHKSSEECKQALIEEGKIAVPCKINRHGIPISYDLIMTLNENGEAAFYFTEPNVRRNGKASSFSLEYLRKNLVEFSFPSEVKKIQYNMFRFFKNLKKVFIAKNVESIGDEAFPSSLRKVEFEDGSKLKRMGSRVFWGAKLEHLRIPSSTDELCNDTLSGARIHLLDFEDNSKLRCVENIFWGVNAKRIRLPKNIEEVYGTGPFCKYFKVDAVEFEPGSHATEINLSTGANVQHVIIPQRLQEKVLSKIRKGIKLSVFDDSKEWQQEEAKMVQKRREEMRANEANLKKVETVKPSKETNKDHSQLSEIPHDELDEFGDK